MRLKDGFVTYETGEEQLLVAGSDAGFDGLVRSNKTAAFIVNCLKQETTAEQIVEKMANRYDAPRQIIVADVEKVLARLRSIGALDESADRTF